MEDHCNLLLSMWSGEYEGNCELPKGHDGPHWDGMTTWRTDENDWPDWDAIDLEEDRARFSDA